MATDAPPVSQTATNIVSQWAAKHGAIQGQPLAINPKLPGTPTTDGAGNTVPGTPIANPNPIYRFTFADGSVLEMDGDGGIKQASEKTPAKTSTAKTAPASEKFLPDGVTPNPNYKDPSKPSTATAASTAKFLPDGVTPNPNYVPPRSATGATQTPAQEAASNAAADASTARAELLNVQTQLTQQNLALAQETDPLKKQQIQSNIDVLNQRAVSLASQAAKADAQTNAINAKTTAPVAITANATAPYIQSYITADQPPPSQPGMPDPVDLGNSHWLIYSKNENGWTNQQVLQNLLPQIASQFPDGLPTDQVKAILDQAHQALTDQQTAIDSAQSYATSVSNQAQAMAQNANDYAVAPGTSAYVAGRQRGDTSVPAPGALTSLPYDPATFAQQQSDQAYQTAISRNQAAMALAHKSQAARDHLGAPVAGISYTSPPAPGGPAAPPPNSAGPSGPPDFSGASRAGWGGLPPYTSPPAASGTGHTITINIGGSGGTDTSGAAAAAPAAPPVPYVPGGAASAGLGAGGLTPSPSIPAVNGGAASFGLGAGGLTPSLPPYQSPPAPRSAAGAF